MAGLYIHIPFCKSRCIYCGFYSTTCIQQASRYVGSLGCEMRLRPVPEGCLQTVYLGGGTPSILGRELLERLFLYINNVYRVGESTEITMECNPDDVTPDFADMLSELSVNRVSMGVQSFHAQRLSFLGRRHSVQQVTDAVWWLRQAGIENISIDLIYGFPGQTLSEWEQDIDAALGLQVEHVSAYALSYEEGTPLQLMLHEGKVKEVDEELSRSMYYCLKHRLERAGYEHYEISNFAKPGRRSRHNSAYWNHTPYIGLGAGAHSFDGKVRSWNVADLDEYMDAIDRGQVPLTYDVLDEVSMYNDLLMISLRTSNGLHLSQLSALQQSYCLQNAKPFIQSGLLIHRNGVLRLSEEGLFVSDMIICNLMMVEE